MVTINKDNNNNKNSRSYSSSSSSNYYLVLTVKILLAVVIILLLPKLVKADSSGHSGGRHYSGSSRKPSNRELRVYLEKQHECEHSKECGQHIPEERFMCVTQCLSKDCHEKFFGGNNKNDIKNNSGPIEDGQVDPRRENRFHTCAKHELKTQKRRERVAARRKKE